MCLALACAPPRPQPVSRPPRPPAAPEAIPAEAAPPGPAPVEPQEPPQAVDEELPTPSGPLLIRVGLATDLGSFMLPCCDPRITLLAGRDRLPLDSATRVDPAENLAQRAVYRLQVAALKDEQQAHGIAEYLSGATGQPADAVFDAGTDLYKVRCGRFATPAEAEALRGRLVALGLSEAWVVNEGGDLTDPGFRITRDGKSRLVPGRWLEVSAPEGLGVAFPNGRYRGEILVYLNDRGRLNVINELGIEDYLRGVVPQEMGPELYNQLEALKAQAVAARTFAVRNLGEFAGEGYDICSTPRCQVYGGMAVEHRVSDRAIAETAGEVVLYDGEPAETFYGSTCGGHTENVEVVFPAKSGAYLRGVPCLEAGSTHLPGVLRRGTPFPAGLMNALLPPSLGKRSRVLGARLEHLALRADLAVPRDRLRSLSRREVVRFIASVFDVVLDRRLGLTASEISPPAADPPPDWGPREVRFAGYLVESGLLGEPADQELDAAEVESLLFHLALYLGVLRWETAHFQALEEDRIEVRSQARRPSYPLPSKLATFRRAGSSVSAAPLDLVAGDRIELYWHRDKLAAVVQLTDAPPLKLSRLAPKQRWSRFKTLPQVRRTVQARYPGFPFEDFEVLSRGVSGRVGKMRLLGSDGRSLVVEGLAVRWTLDVPDTLFHVQHRQPADRGDGWLFEGRGWGHGVGMCQAGAFGMAVRGLSYREILEHYYSGIELGPVLRGK
ncbi:MAG: SpoIID/LytB domain-containing protein [bacterium]|nr:SpoIID/LytB domain-containing protein [bacterium]